MTVNQLSGCSHAPPGTPAYHPPQHRPRREKKRKERLRVICCYLINNQTTFVKVRFILKSVVTPHEIIIHDVVRRAKKGVVLKLV
jgi:hypothetical protein